MRAVAVLLQARAFRSVSLEGEGEAGVVVKRFHHPNPLLALLDRRRARREHAALAALHLAGASVPRPLGVQRGTRGWELRLAAVPRARPLAEHLGAAPPPGGWPALLARLGRLLAEVQQAGWAHGDPHPGNVLVDAHGRPWLIDLQRARRAAPEPARCLAELVECAGHVREALPARTRLCFLVAWRKALAPALRPQLASAALARAVEDRARAFRRASVRAHLDRWLRPSSRVEPAAELGPGALVRRDLAGFGRAELLARAPHRLRAPAAELRQRWLGAARLREHGLPVLGPALYVPGAAGRAGWAAFEEDAGRAPATLASLLADRGLRLHAAELGKAAQGVVLLPPREHDIGEG